MSILVYDDIEEVIRYINRSEKPLALYLFTGQKKIATSILHECQFDGGCVNDTIIHLANSHMGFRGVGQNGMGCCHDYESFSTFSHFKSMVKTATWIDLPMRYHPYTKTKYKLVRIFLK